MEERTHAWYEEQRRASCVQSSAALTQWKKSGELAFEGVGRVHAERLHLVRRQADVMVIDCFFPSGKLCGTCGTLAARMPLNVREWTCECGAVHDRRL